MEKNNFFLEIYNEFFQKVTWPKYNKLIESTLLVFFCSIILSIFFYVVDIFFVFLIKKIFIK